MHAQRFHARAHARLAGEKVRFILSELALTMNQFTNWSPYADGRESEKEIS